MSTDQPTHSGFLLTTYRAGLVIALTFIATLLHDFARDARNELANIREAQARTAERVEGLTHRIAAIEHTLQYKGGEKNAQRKN